MERCMLQARAAMLRDVMAIASKPKAPAGAPPALKKANTAKPVKDTAGTGFSKHHALLHWQSAVLKQGEWGFFRGS